MSNKLTGQNGLTGYLFGGFNPTVINQVNRLKWLNLLNSSQ
jgi:hypothetical protein